MGKGPSERESGPDWDLFDSWLDQREQESSDTSRDEDEARGTEPDPLFDASFIDPLTLADEPAPLAPEALVFTQTAPEPRRSRLVDDRPEPSAASAESSDTTESTRRGPVISSDPGGPDAVAERGTADVAGPITALATPAGPLPPPGSDRGEDQDVVEFAPRTRTHRLVEAMLVLAGAATAVASYVAYDGRSTTSIAVAATMALLTAVLWSATSSSAVATLTVRDGRLDIVRAGSRHSFDLASDYTPIEMVGEPGSRGWQVLFHRRGMTPYVVDASMVDPVEFTRVVRTFRTEA